MSQKNSGTKAQSLDVIVVGAGQAGLGISYFLKQANRRFVVLERGRVGETWRSQRWDSFAVNTPNWANALPGDTYDGPEPDGFYLRDELVESFERYGTRFELPVQNGVTVTAVEASQNGHGFRVRAQGEDGKTDVLEAPNVVIASGIMQTPQVPALSKQIPDTITQLHTADYRSPDALPSGAVVVVGGGQSGCQIAEDLLTAGRKVYMCTSKVGRIPRRYRGRDIDEWWSDMGFLDVTVGELEDPSIQFGAQPQVSGLGRYGHTVSLQQLARDGVTLLGRLIGVENRALMTDDRLSAYIRFADDKSATFKKGIDQYIEFAGIEPPPLEEDEADIPAPSDEGVDAPTRLDIKEAEVTTLIWCTGFTADFDWIRLPVLNEKGMPLHERGLAPVAGIYFLGFPWLHSRKSGIIFGIEEDAEHIAAAIAERLA